MGRWPRGGPEGRAAQGALAGRRAQHPVEDLAPPAGYGLRLLLHHVRALGHIRHVVRRSRADCGRQAATRIQKRARQLPKRDGPVEAGSVEHRGRQQPQRHCIVDVLAIRGEVGQLLSSDGLSRRQGENGEQRSELSG